MGKVVKKIASVALPFIGRALGIAIGGPLGGIIGLGLGSIGGSVLASTKGKGPRNSPENFERLRASIDPRAPRKTIIGISAMAVDIR
jgi:hypothetical protein